MDLRGRVGVSAVLGFALVAGAAGVWAQASLIGAPAREIVAAADAAAVERVRRDRDVVFYERRVHEDPLSAADLARLAALYLQRAREGGGVADFRLAEEAARRSLALRDGRNGQARLVLASSLLAQHRFLEALAAAEELVAYEPERVSYRALLGEIQLELGYYDDARATFTALRPARANLAVAPRLARWAEIEGRPGEAWVILRAARTEALRRPDLPREQVAWFHLRVGDFALRNGLLREAGKALRAGLRVDPRDPRLLGALARLEAARGRWKQAIRYGERAGPGADIATLALVGDAYAALGDSARAREYYARADRLGIERPEPFNRQWTLFRLDHQISLAETRRILEREIEVRQDVYGYDQLAWARYLTGDLAGAREPMRQALRMGTRDALLCLHARATEGLRPANCRV